MAFLVRNTFPEASSLVTILQSQALAIGASTAFHIDKGAIGNGASNGPGSCTITAANGDGTLPVLLTLTREIVAKVNAHAASTVAHKAADTDGLGAAATVASVVSLATAITALNAVKAAYNTHRASTTYHYNADSTNATAAADATNQASADTLANEIKTDFNAHVTSGNVANVPVLVDF